MKIELREHDGTWAAQFHEIRSCLQRELGDIASLIEHVGSTAIPGLCAKPLIDILLVVLDSSDEVAYTGHLEACGFTFHLREPDWHEHRLFKLRSPEVNLHVFSAGDSEIGRMLLFRDFLRSDAGAREAYERKKRELASGDWSRVQDYADAKSDIVEELLVMARRVMKDLEHDPREAHGSGR